MKNFNFKTARGFIRLVDFGDASTLSRSALRASSKLTTGFTLLELLMVVAIIGILAAVVMSSIGDAKDKGINAAIKSNLDTIRNQSELFFTNNSLRFLPAGGSTFAIATCPVYNVAGTNMLSRDANIAAAVAEATRQGGNGNSCYNSAVAWAVAVGLRNSTTTSWCVDFGGNSKQVASAPASAINGTTFLCN